jgi:hypothetical protein
MPPASRADTGPAPLSDEEVTRLREQVARGEAPRVVVRSASAAVPAGSRGPVVRLDDPKTAAEFIVVRLKGDDVPFAPAELAVSKRGRPAAAAPMQPAQKRPPRKATGRSRPARTTKEAANPPVAPAPAPKEHPAPAPKVQPAAAPKAAKASAPAKRSRPKAPASLVVTLRFDGDAWTVEALRGGRKVGKPVPVRAGAARAIGELIGADQVTRLVEETVDACRSEVEKRADALRAQLEAAEAELAQYDR